ncbi:family 43 glycosylhydrolase [Streptomyces sp. NPDC059166]|uniref:family 43 glycosylhydrolase n=1 Tax=Streptomyces sp. NPDC059166 TaxID=3346752 RepID=UPI0036B511AF
MTRASNALHTAIRPGQVWRDTNGNRIQAHGGSILHHDGTFYWYGENKERSTPGSGVWHWGIRCYSSTDLYNWTDEGLIIPPDEDDPTSPLHPAQMVDRPHIIHDARSGRYVCWLKVMGADGVQTATILVADRLLGPYEIVRTGLRPLGMSAGDFDLAVAPDDGKAYTYFERVHSELICADLTDDYTGVTGYYSTHFPRRQPPEVREAPSYFSRHGLHYLITSGTTAYFPNQSEAAVAQTYHGPWTVLGDPHPADPTGTSFRSQVSSVFRHPGKKDLYIALADRWLPDVPAEVAQQAPGHFRRLFSGEATGLRTPLDAVVVDTSRADYVWLPLRFQGDMPILDWRDEWRIEDFQ